MGGVYNIGGGQANSYPILEAFAVADKFTGKQQIHTYVPENRASATTSATTATLGKCTPTGPAWAITISLEKTIRQIVEARRNRI